jgi:hypothetical protein
MKTKKMLAIFMLSLGLAFSASAYDGSSEYWWDGSINIPNGGRICLDVTISDAPAEAYVTAVLYRVDVQPKGDPEDFWCRDYEIYLSNDTHGGPVDHLCVWDNEGGKTDEGQDDDPEDDSSIFLQRLLPTAFDDEPVNQKWYVCVRDNVIRPLPYVGLGRLKRAGWKINYHVLEPDLYDAGEAYRSFSPKMVIAGQSGQSFEVGFRIENGGDGYADSFSVKIYVSDDTYISDSDYLFSSVSHLSMGPSQVRDLHEQGTFPTNIPAGTYYVGWIIDAYDEVAESDETNNAAYKEGYRLTVLGSEPEPDVQVPDVVGMAQADAESTITSAAGLAVGTISDAHSDTVPEGHVISQDPAAGTWVYSGSAVDLVISAGPTVAGLIAHWKLDETEGAIAHDSAGDNDGILYGGTTWQPTGGFIDGALEFDGVDDYVDCGNDASLDITDEITVAAWVKTNDANNGEHNPYVTKGDYSYALKHFGLNSIEFFIYDNAWWQVVQFPVDSSFNDVWHHIAGTYDGSELKLYLNGRLQSTTLHIGHIASSSDNVNMARNSEATFRFYDGLLDDVRIYNCALSPDEIIQLVCTDPPTGDLNGDCRVDFKDLAIFVSNWLTCNLPDEELCRSSFRLEPFHQPRPIPLR